MGLAAMGLAWGWHGAAWGWHVVGMVLAWGRMEGWNGVGMGLAWGGMGSHVAHGVGIMGRMVGPYGDITYNPQFPQGPWARRRKAPLLAHRSCL
jgi:hypothetical protein